jgi:hypothetical protein
LTEGLFGETLELKVIVPSLHKVEPVLVEIVTVGAVSLHCPNPFHELSKNMENSKKTESNFFPIAVNI